MPIVRSYTDVRNNLKSVLDAVNADRVPVLITRRAGGNAVVIAEDEWNSIAETLHLFSNRANALDLLQSMEEMDAGDVVPFAAGYRDAAE